MTEDGAALSITAETARPPLPDNAEGMSAEELTARIETPPDGAQVDIEATEALIDGAAGLLTLSGGVIVTTSTDYRIEATGLTTKLDRAEMESDGGAVQATGPLGTLNAGQARIAPVDGGDASTYLLVFKNGGVKLIYVPKGPGGDR